MRFSLPFRACLVAFVSMAGGPVGPASAQDEESGSGLLRREEGAFDGYTLFAPIASKTVYLLDMDGEVVHRWYLDVEEAGGIYLLENGNLLLLALQGQHERFAGPGAGGGLLLELDWESNVVWRHVIWDDQRMIHHDLQPLPGGNVLVIAWEFADREKSVGWGRDPREVDERGLWFDSVLELRPEESESAEIVWEWHVRDHLVQDRDASLPFFGSVPEEPGRIDINADHRDQAPLTLEEQQRQAELEEQMRALGYTVGGAPDGEEAPGMRGGAPDWLHTNGVNYHAGHDLIVLSVPRLSELWVIDHSTTPEEAAGRSGGRRGRGGDLLWRWGNPRVYGAGSDADQALFFQHDPTWLLDRPGELRLLVFNNGGGRPGGDASSLDELLLPFDPDRGFLREEGQPYGPEAPAWTYRAPDEYFSGFISGVHRLPNGNTLACAGAPGRLYEVTPDGRIVWDYRNPYEGEELPFAGGPPRTAVFRATRLPPDHPGLYALEE